MRCKGIDNWDLPIDREGFDGYATKCSIEDSVLLAAYDAPPSKAVCFIGFAL